ncbi:hypothetical protein L2E82_00341 [Cichorium intybus]|uniref:Uncharacterized protein n=1 Tax=Cichorium intybus TaxID=13427 RepID=A0ACB9GXE5_CICIN|nr:hypothetical protein L2E82_00341 [Cichorium intybus]
MSSSSTNIHGRVIVDPDQEPPLLCDENTPPPCHCKFLAKRRESWKVDNPARRFWNCPQSLGNIFSSINSSFLPSGGSHFDVLLVAEVVG